MLSFYRLLLRIYPAGFRAEYQSALERQFQDDWRDADTPFRKTLFFLRALADIAWEAPALRAEEVAQDLGYAWRQHRRRPAALLLSLGALALAMGLSTGIFSVINALLWRSLPFAAADRLVEVKVPPVSPLKGREGFFAWVREAG